jgi:putative membrane protein
MKHAVLLAAAATAALSLAACQKKATEANGPANATAPEAAAPANATTPEAAATGNATAAGNAAPSAATAPIEPTPAATTAGPPSTEALITGVTLTDLYEVQAGKIAETKGQSSAVKDFGKTMVTDHPAMTSQMKHLFAATDVKIPTELGPRGKGMIDTLNAASPADFDKLYLDQQQAAQEAELALLKGYAEGGESKDIKPAAAKAVPKSQAHLDKVHELQAALK